MSQLKEIENRYYKECNVVMLPTKDETYIVQFSDKSFRLKKRMDDTFKPNNYCHIYITSDDEIKEGDWFIYLNKIYQATINTNENSVWSNFKDFNSILQSKIHKIIAATDKSLQNFHIHKGRGKYWEDEPVLMRSNTSKPMIAQPSQSFIKKYCELGGIDKVLVEYERDNPWNHDGTNKMNLKTDSHNTITIKEVKEKLSSLKDILKFADVFVANTNTAYKQHDMLTWIEENL